MTSSPINFNLKLNSPAIDAGDPNYVVQGLETDYFGNERIASSQIDIGAYEANATSSGDEAASIDGVNSVGENYIALQTGVTQGVWNTISA